MKIDIYQCTDGYEGTWREGLWCGRIREETKGMAIYANTEKEAREGIVEAWDREERRIKHCHETRLNIGTK